MKNKSAKRIGVIFGVLVVLSSLLFWGKEMFFIVIGIGIITGVSPFVVSIIFEAKIKNQKERMFLEFARNLVESVKVGTPISKSIINVKDKPFGILSPHVRKLANQISLGIPLRTALKTFAKDVNNKTISRALTLIGEAEKAGGNIGEILETVAGAVNTSNKLKKERKNTIHNLVMQGYIIFFIFIVIVIVMQFKILPMMSGLGGVEGFGLGNGGGVNELNFSNAFLYLLLAQGFFNGLAIGMLSEGSIKPGIKHSFILMISAFLISSVANLIG